VNQAFEELVKPDANKTQKITQKELYEMVETVPNVIPRCYLRVAAARLYLEQLHNARDKLFANENYAKKLEKRGLPSTFGRLRGARKVVLDEL